MGELSCRIALSNSSLKSLCTLRTVDVVDEGASKLHDLFLTLVDDAHVRIYLRSLTDSSLLYCLLDSVSLARVISASDAFDCTPQMMLQWIADAIGDERVFCARLQSAPDRHIVRLTTGEPDTIQPVLAFLPCVAVEDVLPLLDLQAQLLRQAQGQLHAKGVTTGVAGYKLAGSVATAHATAASSTEQPGTGRSHGSSGSSGAMSPGRGAHATQTCTQTRVQGTGLTDSMQLTQGDSAATQSGAGMSSASQVGWTLSQGPALLQGGQSTLGAGVKRKKHMLR